jgi:deoxyguanosine kinase
MNPLKTYIAVEGVIGVGKTTLARMVQKEFGAQLVLEVFEENPFLSDFYTDRARYAFQTQIFFLLSRYHQQRGLAAIPRPLISDYMFDKDRLFAQVNLDGVELQTYYSVQEALAENISRPDLVVYLKADTDTLMSRITARDRPYERNMEAAYIDSLRIAYDRFFAAYEAAPVLMIDTNPIDFVRSPDDYESILDRIRGALGEGPRQPALPGMGQAPSAAPAVLTEDRPAASEETPRRLSDLQQLDSAAHDPYLNFMMLQTEIGRLAGAFAQRWTSPDTPLPGVREALAGVLASVIKLANGVGVDLETAYLDNMRLSDTESENA